MWTAGLVMLLKYPSQKFGERDIDMIVLPTAVHRADQVNVRHLFTLLVRDSMSDRLVTGS